MKNALSVVGRYGPLVAAILVGTRGLFSQFFPVASPVIDGFVTLFGFFGAQADAEVVGSITGVITSALLVYGGSRKTINIIKGKLAPKV